MEVLRSIKFVPEVYVNKSRDFQLLCNMLDLVNNGVKFDIDTIINLSDTMSCRENMLSLLQHKLGFFTDIKINDDMLRTILKVFPYLVKNKGNKKGIVDSINLFLYINQSHSMIPYATKSYGNNPIEIINGADDISGSYIIKCNITSEIIRNVDILKALLQYVVPTGYFVTYQIYKGVSGMSMNILSDDSTIDIIFKQDDEQSVIVDNNSDTNFSSYASVVPVDEITDNDEVT